MNIFLDRNKTKKTALTTVIQHMDKSSSGCNQATQEMEGI